MSETIDVIYIEDEETDALLFKLGLSSRGINVLHIPDSNPESLKVLDTPQYQNARTIFIDLWVGVVNGVDLAQLLRNRGDERPFFLMTAGENPNPELLRTLNMTYMRKPPDFAKLAALILSLP